MKDSPIDAYELPDSWAWTTLGEIAKGLKAGGTPSKKVKDFYDGGSIPFVKIEDMANSKKYLYDTITKITEDGLNNSSAWIVPKNSLLYSMYASYGIPTINKIEVTTNQAIIVFQPLSDLMSLDFIYYFLLNTKPSLKKYLRGTTQANLNAAIVRRLPVPLAPLAEQHRIVARIEDLFSRLDVGVEALRRARAQLQRYRQSVLQAAVTGRLTAEWREAHPEVEPAEEPPDKASDNNDRSARTGKIDFDLWELPEKWSWTELGSCCELITKGESPKWQGFDYVDQGIPFIRSENVLWGSVDISNTVKIPFEFHKKLKRSTVRPNDVLINLVGASIGRCGVVPVSIQEANINQAVAVIKTKSILIAYYLTYLLISPRMQKQIQENKVETARPNISLGDLNHLKIPLPPTIEQYQIVSEIEYKSSISDNLEILLDSLLKRITLLRQSILQRAFQGKLVPQDPSDEPASLLLERIRAERIKEPQRRGRKSNNHQTRLAQ